MSYLPDDELRDPSKRKPPSKTRLTLWIVGAAAGLYFIGSGLVGILT